MAWAFKVIKVADVLKVLKDGYYWVNIQMRRNGIVLREGSLN